MKTKNLYIFFYKPTADSYTHYAGVVAFNIRQAFYFFNNFFDVKQFYEHGFDRISVDYNDRKLGTIIDL